MSEVLAQKTQGHEAEADLAESPHDITTDTASFLQPLLPQLQDKGLGLKSFSAPKVCDSSFYQITLLSQITSNQQP